MATSPALLGRRIGLADGPDRAHTDLFTKKPSNFSRINPQSMPPLRFFYRKTLKLYKNQPDDVFLGLINKWAGLTPARAIYHWACLG